MNQPRIRSPEPLVTEAGCELLELTTSTSRGEANPFYESLRFHRNDAERGEPKLDQLEELIADLLLLDALDIYRAAVRELVEHHDGLHDDDALVRIIES